MFNPDAFTAQTLSGQQIDGELHRIRAGYEGALWVKRSELQTLCSEVESLENQVVTSNAPPPDAFADVESITADAAVALPEKAKAVRGAEKMKTAYCLRHGRIPESIKRSAAMAAMLLSIVIFGDALVNVSFFLNAHMVAGPMAALLVSFLISLTNVTACACAGYFIGRYRDYGVNARDADSTVFKTIRAKAKWLFRGFVGVMAGFHTTVGLIRSQESLDTVTHSLASYTQLTTTPEAIFLIMIGVSMSVLAYHKGKTAFGGYPGIDECQKVVQAAHEALEESYAEYSESIEDAFEEAEKANNALSKATVQAVEDYNKAVEDCHRTSRDIEQAVGQAESECRVEVAQAVTLGMALTGKNQPLPDDLIARFVSFQHVLDGIDLPAFHHPPDASAYKADLAEAKAAALKRLGAIYRNAINPKGATQ